jgi:DMSO reductase anchor subunit
MRPAYSVIFLTTLIGAGQGLFVAFYAVDLAARGGWIDALPASLHVQACLLAFAFLSAGLAASFFHLGQPLRGWRAVTMWRTSWLSREVLVLPAFMAAVIAQAWTCAYAPQASPWTGLAGFLLCAALFVCTGMIYACLRFLQEWHTPLTVLNFIVLGLASGCMLAAALCAIALPAAAMRFGAAALALTLSGLILRASILARNARLKPKSTLQSATGLKQRRVVQKSQGMTGGSYGAHAFFHGRGAATLRWVKWAFLTLGFVLPALVSALALASSRPAWFIAAFVFQYLGLLAERWFFFAQARHPQNLYYQTVS